MSGHNLPRRIDYPPEDGGGSERPDQDAPAVVPGEDPVPAHVVEGERSLRADVENAIVSLVTALVSVAAGLEAL